MYHYYLNLKSALLGYKKSQVDTYIKEKLYNNYVTLSELSLRVVKLEGDKKQLESTSLKLKANLATYTDEDLPASLYTSLYESMERRKLSPSQRIIVKNTIDDSAITKTIDGVVDVFKQELGVLSDKLDSLSTLMEGINLTPTNTSAFTVVAAALAEDITEDNAEDHMVLSEVKEYDNSMEQYSFIEDITNNSLVISEKSKVETVVFNRDTANSKKPEHNLHKSEKGKLLNFSRINPVKIDNETKKAQPNSFFGIAVNDYQHSDLSDFGVNTNELLDYADQATDSIRYNSFFDNNSTPSGTMATLQEGITVNTEVTKSDYTNNYSESKTQPTKNRTPDQNVTKNVVLSDDARFIRQKYIVGKYAGEDLYDRNGKLIIGRRCQITPQVVDHADREGKLPDLIINMILRDME